MKQNKPNRRQDQINGTPTGSYGNTYSNMNNPSDVNHRITQSNDGGMISTPGQNQKRKNRKRKITAGQVLFRMVLVILVVVIVAALCFIFVKDYYIGRVNIIEAKPNQTYIDENGSAIKISDAATESTINSLPHVDGIHNILLIGIDSRSTSYIKDGSGHLADIIMIMTVNENDNSIKLTSIQRDSYVFIPGYTQPQKVNAAMTYGGPDLLMLVLQSQLRIELTEYAYVDMNHMEKVIDAVGGVKVNVSESERTNVLGGLNELVAEQNEVFGSPAGSHMLTETGDVTLDGRQAVAYARIRKVGNGDYDRSKRQIEVLTSLMSRFMKLSITGKAGALDDVLSLISTNIPKNNLEWYALTFLPGIKSSTFEYMSVPMTGYSNEGMYYDIKTKGEWSIRPNWNGIIPKLQEYIFGKTFVFDPVATIPKAPSATPTPTPVGSGDNTKTGGS